MGSDDVLERLRGALSIGTCWKLIAMLLLWRTARMVHVVAVVFVVVVVVVVVVVAVVVVFAVAVGFIRRRVVMSEVVGDHKRSCGDTRNRP